MTYFGSPSPNGTYDGLIGAVQSNKVNTLMGYLPFNGVPNEPGIMTLAPILSFSPHLYAAKEPGSSKNGLDVLYLFQNFNIVIWSYFIIISILFPISFIFFQCRKFKRLFKFKRMFKFKKISKYFSKCWWHTFLLSVGIAPEKVSKRLSVSILWTFIVISVYYGYNMIFMNTLSGDLSVTSSDKGIDKLKDYLYDDRFNYLIPITYSYTSLVKAIAKYQNGSDEKILYELFMKNYNESIVETPYSESGFYQLIMNLLEQIANRTRVLIEDSSTIDFSMASVYCHQAPDLITKISKSNEPIFDSPLGMLVSHSTHPDILKIFSYRMQTAAELAIFKAYTTHRLGPVLDDMGMNQNLQGYICADTFRNILKTEHESSWNPLPYSFYFRLVNICICSMLVSLIILFVEHFQKHVSRIVL